MESARFAVDLLRRTSPCGDLGETRLLDVGCGTKIVKALVDDSVSIARYAGVDVSYDVISWLAANVSDPRFDFHHLDARNELYNPGGTPLVEFDRLPVEDEAFELISLFSVFTHLDPDDYVAMLRLLRRHARAEARLVFSLFVDEHNVASPVSDRIQQALRSDDPEVAAKARAAVAQAMEAGPSGYRDAVAGEPLVQARYSRDYALELVDGTGWEVESLNSPVRPHIQHYMVCSPQ